MESLFYGVLFFIISAVLVYLVGLALAFALGAIDGVGDDE